MVYLRDTINVNSLNASMVKAYRNGFSRGNYWHSKSWNAVRLTKNTIVLTFTYALHSIYEDKQVKLYCRVTDEGYEVYKVTCPNGSSLMREHHKSCVGMNIMCVCFYSIGDIIIE